MKTNNHWYQFAAPLLIIFFMFGQPIQVHAEHGLWISKLKFNDFDADVVTEAPPNSDIELVALSLTGNVTPLQLESDTEGDTTVYTHVHHITMPDGITSAQRPASASYTYRLTVRDVGTETLVKTSAAFPRSSKGDGRQVMVLMKQLSARITTVDHHIQITVKYRTPSQPAYSTRQDPIILNWTIQEPEGP